ncbi:hypothetical protein GCM10009850_042140 [Nonomuraea monospora]|uniref:Secreted protein n=1 Tax=Nonomuraea monospora TaxID=568818 RepID=A0ABN3CHB6_9ACTN
MVVPQAITLLVYLVMPDPFVPSASAAAFPVIGVHAGQTSAADSAHDDSGLSMAASDEVAMAPREWAEAHAPPGGDDLCLTGTTPPEG